MTTPFMIEKITKYGGRRGVCCRGDYCKVNPKGLTCRRRLKCEIKRGLDRHDGFCRPNLWGSHFPPPIIINSWQAACQQGSFKRLYHSPQSPLVVATSIHLIMSQQHILSSSLVASPEPHTAGLDVSDGTTATGQDGYNINNEFTIHRQQGKPTSAHHLRTNRAKVCQINDLHPYVQSLSLSNLESCVALENAVFPEEERCSRGKVGPFLRVIRLDHSQFSLFK